jgi:hypothetical protein
MIIRIIDMKGIINSRGSLISLIMKCCLDSTSLKSIKIQLLSIKSIQLMKMKNNQMKRIMKKMSIRPILSELLVKSLLDHFCLTRKIKIRKYRSTNRKVNKLNLKLKAPKYIMEIWILQIHKTEITYLKMN